MKQVILFVALLGWVGTFAAKAETVSHKIQPRETLFRISLMYNSTVQDIEKANPGIDARHISYGKVIQVPKNTKMRDPEFVASFLNGNHYNEAPVEQVASKITTTTDRSKPADRPRQVSMPVAQQALKPAVQEDKPAIATKSEALKSVAESRPVAAARTVVQANFSGDENPFLTPTDPKPSATAEEQGETNESVAKTGDEEDENPFTTPAKKAEESKDAAKTSSND